MGGTCQAHGAPVKAAMRYVEQSLTEGEHIVDRRRLHWVIFVPGVLLVLIATGGLAVGGQAIEPAAGIALALIGVAGVLKLVAALIRRATTELAITNLRVLAKSGLIRRDVKEIDLSNIEGVDLHQSVPGRLLGYGAVSFRGTGLGLSRMHPIGKPVEFTTAARDMLRIYREWLRDQYGITSRAFR